ncbi:ComEC/Rec2 family competence protein [Arcanobacterium bovis]|uniref:ComEC/Rec2 family competence protein n=1 Tax=Arcanobacterium bovis TaxID=2529275 RepID=A0A4Q9V1M1_9ACTO|nr:ComEC/Rec2 family competence protein [Arcanobacterium bovis]TBW22021.1 ComEC/Rec2 family competence protein [Arcanobacterium bovis]
MHDYRLVLPAAILWALTVIGVDAEDFRRCGGISDGTVVALVLVVLAVLCMRGAVIALTGRSGNNNQKRAAVRTKIGAVVLLSICVSSIAIINNSVHAYLYKTDPFVQVAVQHHDVDVRAVIVGRAQEMRGYTTYNIAYMSVNGLESRENACVQIPRNSSNTLEYGDPVQFRGHASIHTDKQNCELMIEAEAIKIIGEQTLMHAFVNRVHRDFSAVLTQVESNESDAKALVQGIVLGNDANLSHSLRSDMKNQSLSHLTAVSGSHISILLLAVCAVLGWHRPWISAILATFTIALLTLIVGPSPSVVRAVYMGLFVVLGIGAKRPRDAVALLATTVILVCFVDPKLSAELGFILSVLAAFGIVSCGGLLSKHIAQIMPKWCAELVAIPLVASLWTFPAIATVQSDVSIWGVAANIVVAPVVAPITVCGLSALLTINIAPVIARLFVWGAWTCCKWIVLMVGVIRDFPASHVHPAIVFVLNLLLLAALISMPRLLPKLAFYIRKRARKKLRSLSFAFLSLRSRHTHMTTTVSRRRYISASTILAASLAIMCALPVNKLVVPDKQTVLSDWEVVQCDVGQGSALLLRFGTDTVLVDVGPDETKISKCLNDNSVTKLSLLILSHFDLDHIGGASAVIGKVDVEEIWISPNPFPLYNSRPLMNNIAKHGIAYKRVKAGQSFHDWLRILHPSQVNGDEGDSNRDSLVIDAATSTLHTVVLSDVPQEIQDQLSVHAKEVDVVVVSHHGSKDQSPRLAQAYRPKISLVSVGENNYGHPTAQARRIWAAPMYLTTADCEMIRIGHGKIETSCLDAE